MLLGVVNLIKHRAFKTGHREPQEDNVDCQNFAIGRVSHVFGVYVYALYGEWKDDGMVADDSGKLSAL